MAKSSEWNALGGWTAGVGGFCGKEIMKGDAVGDDLINLQLIDSQAVPYVIVQKHGLTPQ
jgi:hypothetical protein